MAGDLGAAVSAYLAILAAHGEHADTLHHLGIVRLQQGRIDEAIPLIERSLAAERKQPNALSNLGYCFNLRGRHDEAARVCVEAASLDPRNPGAWTNLGNAQRSLGHAAEAQRSFRRALEIQPSNPHYVYNLANACLDLGQFEAAAELFRKALAIDPRIPEACNNLAACLIELQRPQEALKYASAAIELNPGYAEAWSNRGNALCDLRRHDESLACYDRAIEIDPAYAQAWSNRANALSELGRHEAALGSYDRALELNPGIDFLLGDSIQARMFVCEWTGLQSRLEQLEAAILDARKAARPGVVLGVLDSPELQGRAARVFARAPANPAGFPASPNEAASGRRIRIGYFSADFHNHAMMHLMAELFESHDRSRFEIIAFSFGPDRDDEMRRRVVAAFDRFVDVSSKSVHEIVGLSRELEVDIAVDLLGYTRNCRTGIFTGRCAPVQVNFLGYPGTMGSASHDYIVADRTVIPGSDRTHYTEKVVYLPWSYQVNDASRRISDHPLSRAGSGLPETGFVFCCFNNHYKILPETFDGWARILTAVEGSVLWLLDGDPLAVANLRRQAQARDLDPARLIFAGRVSPPEHLARHRLADLFLDTLPYNAHTTASDALWSGLPVLTRIGRSFPGRVAASLLRTVGLAELITDTQQAYEARAIELATDRGKLDTLRRRLESGRRESPLFSGRIFAGHLEAAFQAMHARRMAGLPPDVIEVAASRTGLSRSG